MSDEPNHRETGARHHPAKGYRDANDDFAQGAAENTKPPRGMGLTDAPGEHSENDKSDFQDAPTGTPEGDAQGQSERHHAGGKNSGVSSANPRVLSGEEDGDATFPFRRKK